MATIEYFYASYSAFAYVGSHRFMEIAKAAGAEVVHKPFDFLVALKASGMVDFSLRTDKYKKYHFKTRNRSLGRISRCPGSGFSAHAS